MKEVMMKRTIAVALAAVLGGLSAAAEPPKPLRLPEGVTPEKLADKAEAARVAGLLEKEYPEPRPEGVRMLLAILRGSPLSGGDGWFGTAESRYTWAWLAGRCGLDPKAKSIPAARFAGPAALFDALDRDGDGALTPGDLDWSDRSPYVMQVNMLNRMFRRIDSGGDGKITREELDALFKRLAGDKDHFTADDLRKGMIPRGTSGGSPGDGPSVPVLVRGLFSGEIGSISEGPKVGEKAPDFTLRTPDGKGALSPLKKRDRKPLVLIFGSFT
jgi:hypothetical protein